MFYVALVMALALACVAGVQYFYLLFLEGRIRQQQRRISELEREVKALSEGGAGDGESWPELLDEGRDYSMR